MLKQIGDRVNERRLGSGARAGRRVRDGVRRTQWEFLRRNVRFVATGGVLGGIATAATAWTAPNDFLSGSAVGAGTVFTIGGLAFAVVMLTGTGSRAMGGLGEAWTSQELRPLRRHGWKLLDHVYYRYGDVDHVLVGVWRDELRAASTVLDAGEVAVIWGRLRTQAARTDEREAADPPPPTLTRLYWTALFTMIAAAASVLAVSYTIRWTGTEWSGYLAASAALLLGIVARQKAALRYPALGWLTGLVVITIALIALQLVD